MASTARSSSRDRSFWRTISARASQTLFCAFRGSLRGRERQKWSASPTLARGPACSRRAVVRNPNMVRSANCAICGEDTHNSCQALEADFAASLRRQDSPRVIRRCNLESEPLDDLPHRAHLRRVRFREPAGTEPEAVLEADADVAA